MSGNLIGVLETAVTTIQNRQQPTTETAPLIAGRIEDRSKWRNIIGFWMLGMCNNYGYVVMLTAAFDIIKQFHPVFSQKEIFLYELFICRSIVVYLIFIYFYAFHSFGRCIL